MKHLFFLFLFLFFFFFFFNPSLSLRTLTSNTCDPAPSRDPPHLRSDQITVLINGYSESRLPLLQSLAAAYSASPLVAAVLVLWGNPSTPPQTLAQLSHNLTAFSFGSAPISVVPHPSRSLNARFLPRPSAIATVAVLICDDDVEIDANSVAFAFRVWEKNPNRLIGFFARSHDIDLARREWIYTVHPDRYSIVLTKFMILNRRYLYLYSCGGGAAMARARSVVDRARNCEDILMNFVVAEETGAGPVQVGAKWARDWGDARNEDDGGGDGDGDGDGDGRRRLSGVVAQVGLSSRKAEHRKRRGLCIREFHRVLGKMPLRYSYGKVVNSVREQGLCRKGGKLVFCDQN